MDSDFSEIAMSTEEAVRQIQALGRALYGHITDLDDVVNATVKFNTEGEVSQVVVSNLAQDLTKLTTTVTDVEGAMVKTSVSVASSTSKYREMARAAQESAAALRAIIEGAASNRQAE